MRIPERFKSNILIGSIAAQIVAILLLTGVISVADATYINNITALILQLLVTLGIVNNPTNKTGL